MVLHLKQANTRCSPPLADVLSSLSHSVLRGWPGHSLSPLLLSSVFRPPPLIVLAYTSPDCSSSTLQSSCVVRSIGMVD